ncbi:MAG: hypothetical protein ABWZ64_19485 [Xanthobacteraceae bacterium]|jgi:hypothetical protein
MSDNGTPHGAPPGALGAALGALLAVAIAIFLLSGGEHFGKRTVNSDADLPPVATAK